jgi:alpha-N-arabinofuranosidase
MAHAFPCLVLAFAASAAARAEDKPMSNQIVITTKRLQKEPISPLIYGNFVELLSDLVPAMWAEKLDVTSFEFLRTPEERERRRSKVSFDPQRDPQDRLWRPIGEKATSEWTLDPENPFNGQVSERIRLAAGGAEAGIAQDGIFVEKGRSYNFTGHFRQRDLAGPVHVELRDGEAILARKAARVSTTEWREHGVTLKPSATTTNATFVIRITSPGTLWIDRVSLMPARSINGWRPDAVAAIRDMKPGILRWGGSVIEAYDWRCGIGPWQKRVPFFNAPWGRIDQNLVGIDEFVAFCRATGSEPLLCVRWSGQKPSDAAELVEYCNGPATSPLGALRAQNGHRTPYAVKHWQVGNEVGGDAYDRSFADFARAMRRADPSIKILASYISESLLKNAADLIDYVCPHHYGCANLQATEANIRHYADLLQRFAPNHPIKLAVTEWNTTAGMWGQGRHTLWTLWNGLACARYLNLCHRYADLIQIACRSNIANSYCSGIIQTNNHALYGTPAYCVARLYAEHGGAHPLALDVVPPTPELDISANLSADGRTLSLLVVNHQAKPLGKTINLAAFGIRSSRANVWTIADADDARDPQATNSFERPERIATKASALRDVGKELPYTFPAYSVTLIEFGVRQ